MTPTVGRVVHYQSYGTPGGEYPSVPRAAIITDVPPLPVLPGLPPEECPTPEYHATHRYCPSCSFSLPPDGYPRLSLAVLNPTGLFFDTDVPYAETPTPGHWSWPPRV